MLLPTFIALPFVFKIFVVCIFLSGRFTQVLLSMKHTDIGYIILIEKSSSPNFPQINSLGIKFDLTIKYV